MAREVYSEFPPRSEYVLTERGRSLFPVVKALVDWGLDNLYDGEDDVREEVVRLVGEAVPELSE